jgi:hypothetical protein
MTTNRIKVKGIILIMSCQFHKEGRLKNLVIQDDEIDGWKVHPVIGDMNLDSDYKFEGRNLILKCEDGYIHLLKKDILAMEILSSIYDIEEGILNMGDDIIIYRDRLSEFLKMKKTDVMGHKMGYDPIEGVKKRYDPFISDYYFSHKDQVISHNLPSNVFEMNQVPRIKYTSGPMQYFSLRSCKMMIDHMKSVNYDLFHYSEEYGYPYIIHDIGIGYILRDLPITDYKIYHDDCVPFTDQTLGKHTNIGK